MRKPPEHGFAQNPKPCTALPLAAGQLVAALLRGDMVAIAGHEKGGSFVLKEAVAAAGPSELVALGGVLFQHVTQLATNKFGVHMAAKLASRLVRRTWPLPMP